MHIIHIFLFNIQLLRIAFHFVDIVKASDFEEIGLI